MENNEKKKHSWVGYLIFIGLIILIIITLGLICIVNFVLTNRPISSYKKLINTVYDKYEEKLIDFNEFNVLNDELNYYIDLNFDTNMEQYNKIKDDHYILSINSDLKNNYLDANLKLVNKDNELGFKFALNKNVTYFESKDLYKKPIVLSTKDIEWDDFNKINYNQDDMFIVSRKIKDEIIKTLKEDNFTKEKVKDFHNLNEEKIFNVTKINYSLNNDELYEVLETITEDLIKDKDFMKAYQKLTGQTKKEASDAISNLKEINIDATLNIDIYVKGLSHNIIYTTISFINDDDNTILFAIDESNKANDEYSFKLLVDNETFIDGKVYDIKDNDFKLKGNIYSGDDKVNLEINYQVLKDSNNEKEYKVNFKIKNSGSDEYIKVNLKYGVSNKVNKLITKDAVNVDNLTEQEEQEIINKLSEKLPNFGIYQIIFGSVLEDYEI